MAVICEPELIVPEHRVTRAEVAAAVPKVYEGHSRLRTILDIVENSGIDTRYFVQPFDRVLEHPGIEVRNSMYMEEAQRMGIDATRRALHKAGLDAADIDLIIVTSCTGFMIPSLDAVLLNELDFKSSTKRMPISQLGCAGGAGAVARAHDFCMAYPEANVLIVAAELCSLCFQPEDRSLSAIISALLFGDGVAACVVRGSGGTGLDVLHNGVHFLPDTRHYMGFDLKHTGFHIVLDRAVPGSIETQIAPAFTRFVAEAGLDISALGFYVLHPGGPRLMDEMVRCLGIPCESIVSSRECLARVGNLSSASIFGVLQRTFEAHRPAAGETGFLAAFGPGFSVEMSLGKWVEE